MTLHVLDRVYPDDLCPVIVRTPECVEPGCWRPPYEDGLCKRHHDLAYYRSISQELHAKGAGR